MEEREGGRREKGRHSLCKRITIVIFIDGEKKKAVDWIGMPKTTATTLDHIQSIPPKEYRNFLFFLYLYIHSNINFIILKY